MGRHLRIEYPGAIYHVINRGDQRDDIFFDDHDRLRFLSTLGEACEKTEWQIHAWCLMRNHFHLVIETPQPNLVHGMKWLLGVYTKRFNIRHKTCGHLFAGRYKALLVDGSSTGYLRTACDYVHLNPIRAKILQKHMPLETFVWSSYRDYLKPPLQRPPWLRVDRLLGEHNIPRDTAAGRRELSRQMQHRRLEADDSGDVELTKDWCLGSDEFRKELLNAAAERVGHNHYGRQRSETIEQKAERIIAEELKRIGCPQKDLPRLRKGADAKIAVAHRLRRETTVTYRWIADRLHMGTWLYVSNLLHGHYKRKNV